MNFTYWIREEYLNIWLALFVSAEIKACNPVSSYEMVFYYGKPILFWLEIMFRFLQMKQNVFSYLLIALAYFYLLLFHHHSFRYLLIEILLLSNM